LVITSSDVRSSGQSGPRRIHDGADFGGGAHCIEQAARAIAGRLIPQLPARRRFHRTLLISAGPSSWARAAVPYRAVRMAGFDGASAKIRTTIDTLELKMRLAIAISN